MVGVTPTLESDKCPPIAAFCELAVRLYTPNLNNLGAKSSIVSGLHLKYSRFSETQAGDQARSALRGVGRSSSQLLSGSGSHSPLSTKRPNYSLGAGGFASGAGAGAAGSAVVPRSSDGAAQSPAQSLVPLTVPTS